MTQCPEHELTLVTFDALPPDPSLRTQTHDDTVLGLFEPRYGRALVAAGAVLGMLAFMAPLAWRTDAEVPLAITGVVLAARHATVLWAMPGAAVMLLVILARRRTPERLRTVRLLVPLVAVMMPISASVALRNVWRGAEQMTEAGHPATVTLGWGTLVVVLATALAVAGGLRLGVLPKSAELPHGGGPPEGESPLDPS